MIAAGTISFTATLHVEHRRNGVLIAERFSGPREPTALRAMKDPWYKQAISYKVFSRLFDPWARQANELIYKRPMNIVTAAGIDYLASNFSGTGNMDNFKYHDCGTGYLEGSTNTVANATATSPVTITETGHGRTTNDLVQIAGITGITGANGNWQILVTTVNAYTLYGSAGGGSGFGGSPTAQSINSVSDTALVSASGGSRVAGTATNPNANQYQSVATLSASSGFPLSIVEWGLFSASGSGTLWDRRWLNTANAPSSTGSATLVAAPITLTSSSDTITFTYVLTCNAGGS